jgi:hypothetical protein
MSSNNDQPSAAQRLALLQGHLIYGENHINTGTRDLTEERSHASFSIPDMVDFFAGDRETAQMMVSGVFAD